MNRSRRIFQRNLWENSLNNHQVNRSHQLLSNSSRNRWRIQLNIFGGVFKIVANTSLVDFTVENFLWEPQKSFLDNILETYDGVAVGHHGGSSKYFFITSWRIILKGVLKNFYPGDIPQNMQKKFLKNFIENFIEKLLEDYLEESIKKFLEEFLDSFLKGSQQDFL